MNGDIFGYIVPVSYKSIQLWLNLMGFINNKKVLFGSFWGIFAFSFVSILPVSAQQYQLSCDDRRSLSGVQMQTCARLAYEKADGELNLVWKQVISQLSGDAKERLIDRQLAWIEKRDSVCDDETRVNRGGSGYRIFLNDCLRRVTIERTEFLRDYLR